MDFDRLTRRELQALCKINKIPANMKNAAMAESLKALEIVEGIKEFLSTCESETAQSSIDSPVRSEVTSPCVPPTGGRTARRRNASIKEPKTTRPSIRAQRTTRRTRTKDVDEQQAEAIETPVAVPQTNRRRKVKISSACRNMDSQLKECVATPALSVVTTRRRQGTKEDTEVKRVFSTRRSARLAQKNVDLSTEVGNENPDFLKKELFTIDCQELKMNTKESLDDLNEISGITGAIDADITVEENEEAEIVSVKKQKTSSVNEVELVPTIEDKIINDSEVDGPKSELKESNGVEIEGVRFRTEIEIDLEKEKYDEIEAPTGENEEKCEAEVVSVKKQETSFVNEVELVPTSEHKIINDSEVDGHKSELKESNGVKIEDVGFRTEIETNLKKEKCVEIEAPTDENEEKGEAEVVSVKKQETSFVNEVELVPTSEHKIINDSEVDGHKSELKESNGVEIEEVGFRTEIETNLEKEKCDEIEAPTDENKAQDVDDSHDVQTLEIVINADKIEQPNADENACGCEEHNVLESEEQDTDKVAECEEQTVDYGENDILESEDHNSDKDAASEDMAATFPVNAVFESEDNFAIAEVPCEVDIIEKEISCDNELDSEDVADLNVDEEMLEINGSHDVQLLDIKIEVWKTEEDNTDDNAQYEDKATNYGENAGLGSDELNTDNDTVCEDDAESDDLPPPENEIEVEKTEEQVTNKDEGYEDEVNGKHEAVEANNEMGPVEDTELQLQQTIEEVMLPVMDNVSVEKPGEIDIVQSKDKDEKAPDQVPCIVQLTCLSPIIKASASKASSAKKKMAN